MTLSEQQKKEILDQQTQKNTTKRVTSPELEKILYEAIPVLDHGFVRVVDYMGDDSSIVQAARVSYGKGTKKVSTDSGLIKYLMRHRHSTPFEMCEIKYHVKLPIFVARQWIRHRTANVNEYSARYSILDKEFYLPSKENLAAQSTSNRQGRGEVINGKQADNIFHPKSLKLIFLTSIIVVISTNFAAENFQVTVSPLHNFGYKVDSPFFYSTIAAAPSQQLFATKIFRSWAHRSRFLGYKATSPLQRQIPGFGPVSAPCEKVFYPSH